MLRSSECKLTQTLDPPKCVNGGSARVGLAGFDPQTHPMWGDGIAWVASGCTLRITVHTKESNRYVLFSNVYFREWTDQRARLSRLRHCESQFELRKSCDLQGDVNHGKEYMKKEHPRSRMKRCILLLRLTASESQFELRTSCDLQRD